MPSAPTVAGVPRDVARRSRRSPLRSARRAGRSRCRRARRESVLQRGVPRLVGRRHDEGEALDRPGVGVDLAQVRAARVQAVEQLREQHHRRDVGVVGARAVHREQHDGGVGWQRVDEQADAGVDGAVHVAQAGLGDVGVDDRADRVVAGDAVPQLLGRGVGLGEHGHEQLPVGEAVQEPARDLGPVARARSRARAPARPSPRVGARRWRSRCRTQDGARTARRSGSATPAAATRAGTRGRARPTP